jgi:hypothetical protein
VHRKDDDIVITDDDINTLKRVMRYIGYSLFLLTLFQRRERRGDER